MASAATAGKTYDELVAEVAEAKDELFKLRFQHATGQLGDVGALGQTKKHIARLLTRMRALEIEAAEAQENG